MKNSKASMQVERALLKQAGIRVTAARLAVLNVMSRSSAPMSHAQVHELVAERFDRATVYRNLIDLVQAGLVQRTDVGDHTWRFERVNKEDHPTANHHAHFVCSDCGSVECLPLNTVMIHPTAEAPKALNGAGVEIRVRGICDTCG